jgi:hypothetical protein
MRMAEQGRLATAPNVALHLTSSIRPLGIGEFPVPVQIGCGAVLHGAAGGLLDTTAHHAASAGYLALASNEHVLKAAEHAANGLSTDGGKALENVATTRRLPSKSSVVTSSLVFALHISSQVSDN